MTYDISEAAFGGAVLFGFEKILAEKTTSQAAMSGALLAGSDLVVQGLGQSRGLSSLQRKFLWKQQRPMASALLYTLTNELLYALEKNPNPRMYEGEMWKSVIGNLFLASGSQSIGTEISKGLGFSPGAITIANALANKYPQATQALIDAAREAEAKAEMLASVGDDMPAIAISVPESPAEAGLGARSRVVYM